jgi:hypothetical protein
MNLEIFDDYVGVELLLTISYVYNMMVGRIKKKLNIKDVFECSLDG